MLTSPTGTSRHSNDMSNSRPSYFIRNREKCNRRRREYERKRRNSDPEYDERRKAQARAYQQRRKLAKRELLYAARNKPCVDCQIQLPPPIMDLDHVRGKKLFNIGGVKGNAYHSLAALKAEIEKCDVRCPNCHRLRHYNEAHAGDL